MTTSMRPLTRAGTRGHMGTQVTAARTPQHFSRRLLEEALILVAERWNLSWINAADYKILGVIEGCAHELSHALDLGPDFETSIRAMTSEEANQRETATLRIEVAALARLGVHLSMRRLRASANWEDSASVIPTIKRLRTPLDHHEAHCVDRFLNLITEEIQKLHGT